MDVDAVIALHLDERMEGGFGDLIPWNSDAGERRLREGTDRDVVESDEGDVIGNA